MAAYPEDLDALCNPPDTLHPFRNAIATAIGQVSMAWIDLEIALNRLMHELCNGSSTPLALVSGVIDFRDKMQIVKILAFHRHHNSLFESTSVELFERLERLLNRIDNNLRPARNMIVHQQWTAHGFINVQPKIIRPQSRQRGLQHNSATATSIDDVWSIAGKIILAQVGLSDIQNKVLTAWPRPLDGISPGQLLLLMQAFAQRQEEQDLSKP